MHVLFTNLFSLYFIQPAIPDTYAVVDMTKVSDTVRYRYGFLACTDIRYRYHQKKPMTDSRSNICITNKSHSQSMQKCTFTYCKTTCGYIHCSLHACGNSGLGFYCALGTHRHFYAYSHRALNGYFCITPHFIGLCEGWYSRFSWLSCDCSFILQRYYIQIYNCFFYLRLISFPATNTRIVCICMASHSIALAVE